MNKILRGAIFAMGLACAAAAHGAAYKCVDDSGRTVYSDIPCAKKAPPPAPPPKVEAAKPVAKPGEPVALTKITEADVTRALDQTEEYITRNNHSGLCSMFAEDLKFKYSYPAAQAGAAPKVNQGGRNEMCILMRENAEQSKRTGLVQQTDRGPTKVVIEAGDARASAAYESVVKVTRYDRIISTMRCTSRAQLTLTDGKLLYVMMEDNCK